MTKERKSMDGFVRRNRGDLGDQHQAKQTSTRREVAQPETARATVNQRSTKTTLGSDGPDDISASLASIDDAPQDKRKKKKIGRKRKIAKRITVIIIAIVLAVFGWLAYRFVANLMQSTEGGLFGLAQREPLQEDENGRSNFVIFGTAEDNEGGQHDGENLTDSVMLLSVNQTTKDAYMISVPRDLWVRYDDPCSAVGYEGKINAVYFCASQDGTDEQAGAEALKDKVGEFFGIDAHYYVHVNFTVVEQAVDAVGGVTVTIETDDPRGIYDPNFDWRCNYECRYVDYEQGETVHLDGEHALALARARNAQGGYGLGGGNFDREQNQQKILKSLREQALSAGTLSNISRVTQLMDAFGNNLRTNVQTNELQTLVGLANDVSNENIMSLTLVDETDPLVTTGEHMAQSIVQPTAGMYDYSEVHAYVQRHSSQDPVVREGAPIVVLNGTGQPGVAGGEQVSLENQGFYVSVIDDAPADNYGSIEVYITSDDYPETSAALRRHYGLEELQRNGVPVAVAPGTGFVVVIGEAPEVVGP